MKRLTNGQDIMFSNAGAPLRHKVTYLAWLLVLCLGMVKNCAGLPVIENFYPFDINGLDNETESEDDGGSDLIHLDIGFPFFNYTYSSLYVNNNGIVSFKEELKSYKPLNFNNKEFKEKIPIVAPFWADVDTENFKEIDLNESVVYRITNDSALLNQCSQDIKDHFFGQDDFTARLMIIVTWYNVGYYGAAGTGKRKRNTFQAVLVTSGDRSFAIFNYDKIVWTTGSNSGGSTSTGLGGDIKIDDDGISRQIGRAVVGFSSGDLHQFYLLEHSGTDEILNITQRSNIGVPGKFIFRLDGKIDDHSCFGSEEIAIFPRTVSMLGREAVRVTGPCLSGYSKVRARIREFDLEFSCHVIEDQSGVCVIPTLFRTGEVTFELNPYGKGWNYAAGLSVVNTMTVPVKVTRHKLENWNLGKKVTVTWDPHSAPRHKDKTLEVLAYNASDVEPRFQLVQKFTGIVLDTHKDFKLLRDVEEFSTLVIRLCWMYESHPDTLPVCIWSDVFPVRWQDSNSKDSEQWCEKWLFKEVTLPPIVINPLSCPCLASMADSDSGHFHKDPLCDIDRLSVNTNCVYNANAHMCYRMNSKSVNGSGETCCYNEAGNLMDIRNYPGAGTHQRYHYRSQEDLAVPFFSYFESDLLPKLHCCQYSSTLCREFVKFRPATTCQDYKPPSPAQAAGDPHLVTLDGQEYSFNGVGDFYLVTDENESIVIQVRAVPAKDENGHLQNATVFSNIAVAIPRYSDTVEIRKSEGGADVLVNSKPFTPTESTTSQFKNISLLQNDDGGFLIVLEPVSVSVTVEATPDLLNIIVLIGEDSFRGKILGLLGNYNGNGSDDFIARNGTVLKASSPMRDIHFDFGMTWLVPSNESIVSPAPVQLQDYVHFQPAFMDEQSNKSLRNGTYEICGTNKPCIFDYQVTGKESVAKTTAQFTSKFQDLKNKLDQKVVRCPYLDTPVNGNKTQNGDSEGAVAIFTCDQGYEMFGTATRVCQENNTWTGAEVMCAKKKDTGYTEGVSQYIVIIGAASGAGGVVLILVVTLVVILMRKRSKSKTEDIPMDPLDDIPVFGNPAFMRKLHETVGDGPFRIPRPKYVDPSIFVDYF